MPGDRSGVAADGLPELARLRDDVVAAFDRLSRNLAAANDGPADVGQEVARLNALLARLDAGTGPAAALPALCVEVTGLVGAVIDDLGHDDFAAGLAGGGAATNAIRRKTRQLVMAAPISRITGTATGSGHIDDSVRSLRDMTQALDAAAAARHGAIAAIGDHRDTAPGRMRLAAQTAARARRSGPQADSELDDLKRRNADLARALDLLCARLDATRRTETGALVSGIQHGDRLSQRLEHVCMLLADSSVAPATAQALAAAQIAAAHADANTELGRIRSALARLREGGRTAAETLVSDMASEAAVLLDGLWGELAQAGQLRAHPGPVLAAAIEAAGALRERVAEGRVGVDPLRETSRRIPRAAVSAGLLAGRGGTAQAAMDNLSRNVRESAAPCNSRSDACQQALTRIDAVMDASSLPRLEARSQAQHAAMARRRPGSRPSPTAWAN